MDKLSGELQRLHFLPGQHSDSGQQALGIAFRRAADWEAAALLWHAVQDELDLPAPAVSVDGQGYRLWFSLAEPVAAQQVRRFLDGLRSRYLADMPASRLEFGIAGDLPPCQLADAERWGAFIDPGMGSMFTAEPWLEMAPNRNQQADLLAAFASIKAVEFERTLAQLDTAVAESGDKSLGSTSSASDTLALAGPYADPKSFLLAVMNAPKASPQQRIEAAKALLPYFEQVRSP
ncbi:hypothetical protein LZ012_02315 [Dechloromonas sp. XY25]|uniref:Uncharacterized protein n=1 Tax=Dechloromonas hankyongensis TaxID=2908002 RepID=A0ABS9JY69_9RHOO|nr:hypothetical protein [Dechloromonas hankyongensis]MCG2575826.1 hypothetical protein [Dechloromonas hankyongensis]